MEIIKRSGVGRGRPPGQHEVSTGVVGARAGRAPLDGVDFFAVGLQVVDTRVLLHTPDLKRELLAVSALRTQIILTYNKFAFELSGEIYFVLT